MKCKKCGTELGQKNICPICSAKDAPICTNESFSTVDKEIMDKIDSFVDTHPEDWDSSFDDFYDKLSSVADYETIYKTCNRRAEIFSAIKSMLSDSTELSGKVVLKIMDEIPQQYPEIEAMQARQLAKKFYASLHQPDKENTLFLSLQEKMLLEIKRIVIKQASIQLKDKWSAYETDFHQPLEKFISPESIREMWDSIVQMTGINSNTKFELTILPKSVNELRFAFLSSGNAHLSLQQSILYTMYLICPSAFINTEKDIYGVELKKEIAVKIGLADEKVEGYERIVRRIEDLYKIWE